MQNKSRLFSSGIPYSRLQRVTIPDVVIIKYFFPEDGYVDAGNMPRIVM
jgi:hypothetical protein